MPGLTMISKADLTELLKSNVSHRVKTKAKIEVPPKDDSNPIFNGEHITIPEASKLYDVPLNLCFRKDLAFDMVFLGVVPNMNCTDICRHRNVP